ncbi:LuxR family transcriptional regulator [Ruegeria marisrubri]|uniref:helix-turn-helix transcriptional regulator n=1 Tax=Ruegeria marisrubri TaxID=1685379 RepID=UPI001CD6B60E|nr:LuxR family transcriptional regulator [Ruegeria marisrubri]MCA0905152.1 LuxR family transcriptional regulator [Ruegeria marisrubri]
MLQDFLLDKLHDIADDGVAIGFGFGQNGQPGEHFCTYSQAWQDHYWSNGLIYKDPVIAFGATNLGVLRWSDAEDSGPDNAVFQARDFGMKDGLVISVQVDGERAIAGLATASRPSDADISEARAIVAALQAIKAGEPKISLTPRQKDILRLIADGASAASAAHELKIDESTVNFHKREALKKNLSHAKNIRQLVSQAVRTGAI